MFMELVLLEIDYYCIPLKLRQLDYTEAKRNVGAKLPELNGFLYVNYEIVKRLKERMSLFIIKPKKNSTTGVSITALYKKYWQKTFKYSWRPSTTS